MEGGGPPQNDRRTIEQEPDEFTRLGSLIDSGKGLFPSDLTDAFLGKEEEKEEEKKPKLTREQFNELLAKLINNNEELAAAKLRSQIDFLTGAFNETVVKSKLDKLIKEVNPENQEVEKRAERQPAKVAVVAFALDMRGLKAHNVGGHREGGNKALIGGVESLRSNSREDIDILFRIGGDEFLVVKPIISEKTGADLEKFLERVIPGVVQSMQDNLGSNFYIGFSVLRKGENITGDELYDAADQAMTKNKNEEKARKWLNKLSENEPTLKGAELFIEREKILPKEESEYEIFVGGKSLCRISVTNSEDAEDEFVQKVKDFLESQKAE